MADQDANLASKREQRALLVGMFGNLFMGVSGLLAAALSNSQALLVDGLFSLIGFLAALIARNVNRNLELGPDKVRPMGYAADESIFTTFRALSLLLLVFVAGSSAVTSILAYFNGAPPRELNYGPMIIYFAVIGLTCVLLWAYHYFTWRQGGKRSAILQLEAQAAAFDALVTAAAGLGILAIKLLSDGPLGVITPIGDSLVVLMLCTIAAFGYFRDFRASLGELAGVTAGPSDIAAARRAVRTDIADADLSLIDVAVTKLGRTRVVLVYADTNRAITAAELDALTIGLEPKLSDIFGRAELYIVPSQHGRTLPAAATDVAEEAASVDDQGKK